MQQLLTWTLQAIREEEPSFAWLEEYRFEWVPPIKNLLNALLNGKTVLLLSDERHKWFVQYILNNINAVRKSRPFLPFYAFSGCFPDVQSLKNSRDIKLLEDMLSLSFPEGYLFWYIGNGEHPYTKIAFRNEESLLWVMDAEVQNAFMLRSRDRYIDIKLLQLYRLLDKTLTAAICGELDIES